MNIWFESGFTAMQWNFYLREKNIVELYSVELARKKMIKVTEFIGSRNWGAIIRILRANEHAIVGRYRILRSSMGNLEWEPFPFGPDDKPIL
ncbi:MAG: hypothetical protein V1701_02645 [Planctomycetota bacterium]